MQFQPGFTPPFIKRLIQTILSITLVAVGLDPFFGGNLQANLLVTTDALHHPWQFFTSLFLIPSPFFTFSFLIDLAFCLLLFWLIGTLVYERIGKTRFLIACIIGGVASGLAGIAGMYTLHEHAYLSEFFPALLALVTVWTMTDPKQQLFLFFVLPLRAQWLFTIAFIGTVVANGLQQNYIEALSYLGAFCVSYLYALIVLQFQSPFEWMTGFDRLVKRVTAFWQWRIANPVRNWIRSYLFRFRK